LQGWTENEDGDAQYERNPEAVPEHHLMAGMTAVATMTPMLAICGMAFVTTVAALLVLEFPRFSGQVN
jgi:hypothetical protein